MKLTILGGTLLVLFLPLAALAGSEEFYDWFGATDPGARRFVETMVKAGLAEEIHREIDPRMTPEAYLEVLDQIAAGDMEGVRPRLRPDGVRRLLRYITGGDRIVDMPDVPEVADAEWGRFARWADERDVSAFRTWLGERTERWRRMEEIGGLDTMEKMDRMFSQWWGRARNQIGQGRQRDRARYLARFEEAARRVALTRAAAFHRAAEDQRELRFAVLVKYIEIQDRIVAERARWAETRRALRRAGERDEDGTMALRYWSDAAFRREVDQKGRGRGESPLLTSGRLLGYAETATGELRSARKTLEKSKEALVVPVSTEALEKFRTDYAVILDAIVGNEVFWDEGRAALREWEKAEKDYTGLLSEIAQQYRRDAKKPKTGPDLAAQLSTEAETLEETLRQHEAGVGALRTERLAAAGPALAEVRAAAEGAQAQLRTRFFAGRYDAAHEQVSARAREGLAQTAAQRLGPSAEAGQFRDQAVGGRYDPAVAANYVRRGGKTPEEALSSMDGFLAAGVTGYEQETARLFTELEGMGSDDADLIRARVEAFRALEEAYYPRENLVAIATGEQGGRRDRRAEFDPDPERFWKEHIDQLVGLNLRRRNALESLRAQRVELANLVAFTAEAREDFAAGRRSLGYARELSEGAQAIARRAGGSGPVVLPPEATELVARPSLAADLREMVRRSGSARSLFDGRSSGYEKALAGTNRSSLGLDAPTYAPLRRSLAWHRSTLDALNRATTPAVPDLPRVQAEARELLAQYDALAGESPLVADGVLAAKREAEASLASLLGGGDANLAALVREYAAYVQAAEAQAAEDERTVDSYLAEAERALSFRGGSADDRLRVLNGGRATANLAARHLEAVKAYGLYAPEFSGHEQRLARFNSECDRLLAQVGPVDPVVFERRGSFHVIVNGISTRLMRPDIPNALNSADGTVEIRSDLYDAAFQGARKVLVRVDPEGATQPNWSVASTGTADFAIRATLSSPGVYVLDLRVVDRAGTGFAPGPFPLRLAVAGFGGATTGRYEDILVGPKAPDEDFLYGLFRSAFHREPTATEISAWRRELAAPGAARSSLVQKAFEDPAYQARKTGDPEFIRDAFQAVLGREPTATEQRDEPVRLRAIGSRRTYLMALLDGAEYRGIMAGTWPGPGGTPPATPTLSLGTERAMVGGQATIPLRLSGLARLGSLTAVVVFDPASLELIDAARGDLPATALFDANPSAAGSVQIALADARGLDGEHVIARLTFRARGRPGRSYEVRPEVRAATHADTSAALSLAVESGAVSIVTPSEMPGGAPPAVAGDWNRDGRVSSVDALAALRMATGRMPVDAVLDMDGDGQVTARDALLLLKRAVEAPAGGGTPPPTLVWRFTAPRQIASEVNPFIDPAQAPVFSGDGKSLVFASSSGLIAVDVATRAARPLIFFDPEPVGGTPFGAHARGAAEPVVAGDRVIYRSTLPLVRSGRSRVLYMSVPLAGGKPVPFLETGPEHALLAARPDGFVFFHSAPGASPRLILCPGPTPDPARPASTASLPLAATVWAASPDLKWAAFALSGAGGPPPWDLRLVELASGRTLSFGLDRGFGPLCFSPDGTHVAAVRVAGGKREVVAFSLADPTRVYAIAGNLTDCSAPAWSPDGTKVAWVGQRAARVWEVFEIATLR